MSLRAFNVPVDRFGMELIAFLNHPVLWGLTSVEANVSISLNSVSLTIPGMVLNASQLAQSLASIINYSMEVLA